MEKRYRNDNDEAAKWRLRVTKRDNIFSELIKIGSCTALMCGSLLILPVNGIVRRLTSYSHWRETLENSPMFNRLDKTRQNWLRKMPYDIYSRLEDSLNCLGRIIALSCEDQSNSMMLEALSEFKIWSVLTTLQYKSADEVLNYIKWVAKAAQACFLQAAIPEIPAVKPGKFLGQVVPFVGPLKFISELVLSKRDRTQGLTLEEGRSIAQMASLSRSLPYPSDPQIRKSVKETIELVTTAPAAITADMANKYQEGLRLIKNRINRDISLRTHVSLAASGSLESSRSNGGRGADLVRLAKPVCNIIINDDILSLIERKVDVFGHEPISQLMAFAIRGKLKLEPEKVARLGHFLYGQVIDIEEIWTVCEDCSKPPRELPKILNLVTSDDLLKYGHYDTECESIHGMLLFKPGSYPVFQPDRKTLPVRADISVESGMKTRLTTSAPTAYVHFGQQIGHVLRDYLRTDPFLQVGFEEPDKLWEVLKQYRTQVFKTDFKLV